MRRNAWESLGMIRNSQERFGLDVEHIRKKGVTRFSKYLSLLMYFSRFKVG